MRGGETQTVHTHTNTHTRTCTHAHTHTRTLIHSTRVCVCASHTLQLTSMGQVYAWRNTRTHTRAHANPCLAHSNNTFASFFCVHSRFFAHPCFQVSSGWTLIQ